MIEKLMLEIRKIWSGKSSVLHKSNLVNITLLILVAIIVYFNSLFNQFVYDDYIVIFNNEFLTSFKNIPQLFSPVYFYRSCEASYRPLVTFSYMLDYFLFKFKAFGYHLMNLIWHILNGIMLYWLMRLVFKKKIFAFLIALFFICHPIQTEAVNSIGFREELLFTFFYLLAFIFYIKKKIIFSLFFFTLSCLSKEMALTLPLMIFIYILFFERKQGIKPELKDSFENPGSVFRKKLRIYYNLIPYLIIAAAFIFIRFFIMICPFDYSLYCLGGSLSASLLTSAIIVIRYILLLLFPYELSVEYVVEPVTSIFQREVLLSLAGIIAILAVAVHYFRRNKKLSFAIFWFFVTLIPVYNIIPIFNPMGERYLYLPAIGFYILLAMVWQYVLIAKKETLKKFGYATLVFLVACYSIISIYRNFDWRNSLTLWFKTVITAPDHWGVHNGLGIVYLELKDYALAKREFLEALKYKREPRIYYNMGFLYWDQGDLDKAQRWWEETIRRKPDYVRALNGLASIYTRKGMYLDAEKFLMESLMINPYTPETYYFLSENYYLMGKVESAITCLIKITKLSPKHLDLYLKLGLLNGKIGKFAQAIKWLNRGMKIAPADAQLHYVLGRVYLDLKQMDKAIAAFENSLKFNQNSAMTHYYYGLVLEKVGKNEQAQVEFEKAKKIEPNFTPNVEEEVFPKPLPIAKKKKEIL